MIPDIPEIYLVLDTVVKITGMIIDYIRNHLPVFYPYYPRCIEFSQFLFMCNQYYQLILRKCFDNIHYLKSIPAVKISGRFICNYNCRVFDYSSGNTYTLPFASRKHICISVPIPVHTDFLQNIVDFFLNLFLVSDTYHFQCNCHIVKHGHIIDKIVILENIPYIEGSDAVNFSCPSSSYFLSIYIYPSFVDLIQSSNYI